MFPAPSTLIAKGRVHAWAGIIRDRERSRAPMNPVRHDAAMDAHGDPRHELRVLELLDALVVALERHAEVGETIASSADAQEAVRRLQDLLGVSELAAVEVSNIQWRKWTREERAKLRSRRDELLARRDDLIARRDSNRPN